MTAWSRALTALVTFPVVLCGTSAAFATESLREQCIDSHEQAQKQRIAGKLRASQESLRFCSSAACPDSVRNECTKLFGELDRLVPSVVFEVDDGAGKAIGKVRVTIDGQPFAEKLDGVALPVDPGEHTFTFEVADRPVVVQKLAFQEGATRRERVTIAAPSAPPPAGPPPNDKVVDPVRSPPPAPDAGAATGSGQRVVGVILGVTGVVGLGVGGLLGGLSSSQWSSSKASCASSTACLNRVQALEEHDSATSLATGSTVAFVAGGVLAATGLVVFFLAPKPGATTSASVTVVPSMAPGGGGMMAVGRF